MSFSPDSQRFRRSLTEQLCVLCVTFNPTLHNHNSVRVTDYLNKCAASLRKLSKHKNITFLTFSDAVGCRDCSVSFLFWWFGLLFFGGAQFSTHTKRQNCFGSHIKRTVHRSVALPNHHGIHIREHPELMSAAHYVFRNFLTLTLPPLLKRETRCVFAPHALE